MTAPCPMTTKIPVPMIAPTPMAVSWLALTARLSSCPASCVSVTSVETSRMANTPGRPAFRTAMSITSDARLPT